MLPVNSDLETIRNSKARMDAMTTQTWKTQRHPLVLKKRKHIFNFSAWRVGLANTENNLCHFSRPIEKYVMHMCVLICSYILGFSMCIHEICIISVSMNYALLGLSLTNENCQISSFSFKFTGIHNRLVYI